MIPSRGIVRSIPSGVPKGLATAQLPARTFATRSLHSSRAAPRSSSLLSSHGTRAKLFPRSAAGPLALGSVASSRNLSLWGWGGSKDNTAAEQARQAAAAVQEQAQAASSASDAVTDNVSAAASPITEPPVAATEVDAIMDIITGQDILDLNSDQVGYLKALGLDFGWGFTSTMQWVLENIHVATGLGWAGSIIAAAFALRGIMLYPHIMSMRNGAKMNRMQADPRSKDMLALSQAAAKSGDQALIQQASFIRGKLQKEYGVSMWGMGWAFLQFPFTFGLFNLVRQMAALPVPGMESAGFLWFTDLTVRDPYLALPALATAIMIASLSIGRKYMSETQQNMMKPMMYAIGGIGMLVTSFLSAGINLMGVAFAAATLCTTLILDIPVLRAKLGLMAAAPKQIIPSAPATPSAQGPNVVNYQAPRGSTPAEAQAEMAGLQQSGSTAQPNLRERLNASLDNARKGMSEQFGSMGNRFGGSEADRAERKRRDLLKKLEETRRDQEREEFQKKYKK